MAPVYHHSLLKSVIPSRHPSGCEVKAVTYNSMFWVHQHSVGLPPNRLPGPPGTQMSSNIFHPSNLTQMHFVWETKRNR